MLLSLYMLFSLVMFKNISFVALGLALFKYNCTLPHGPHAVHWQILLVVVVLQSLSLVWLLVDSGATFKIYSEDGKLKTML